MPTLLPEAVEAFIDTVTNAALSAYSQDRSTSAKVAISAEQSTLIRRQFRSLNSAQKEAAFAALLTHGILEVRRLGLMLLMELRPAAAPSREPNWPTNLLVQLADCMVIPNSPVSASAWEAAHAIFGEPEVASVFRKWLLSGEEVRACNVLHHLAEHPRPELEEAILQIARQSKTASAVRARIPAALSACRLT